MSTTLQDRMVELMTATGWTVGEIAAKAGVTSAAVSQWLGNGSGKQSKSIGNVDAALRLEKASGFNWLWLAKGKGPKLVETPEVNFDDISLESRLRDALEVLTTALKESDKNTRIALEPLLASMANDPDDAANKSQLILTLLVTSRRVLPTSHHSSSRISGELGRLGLLGDEADEQRNRAAASGGSKG